jgi:hypothetical protein
VEFVSKLRNNTKTVFTLTDVQLNAPIDEQMFSMSALTR